MPIDINTVADQSATTPAPTNSEPAPEKSGLPEELLAMPIFAGILQGAPAAVWTNTGDKSPEAVESVKAGKQLNNVGLFFYRDDPTKTDVLYNAQFISPELIKKAAEKGKLREVASNLAETVASFNGTGAAPAAPEAGAGGALPAAGMPSPVPVDSALNTARVGNLSPGGPTTGPLPGAGRVLNSIATPTV